MAIGREVAGLAPGDVAEKVASGVEQLNTPQLLYSRTLFAWWGPQGERSVTSIVALTSVVESCIVIPVSIDKYMANKTTRRQFIAVGGRVLRADVWLTAWLDRRPRTCPVLQIAEEMRAIIDLLKRADSERRPPLTRFDEVMTHRRRLEGLLNRYKFVLSVTGIRWIKGHRRLWLSFLPVGARAGGLSWFGDRFSTPADERGRRKYQDLAVLGILLDLVDQGRCPKRCARCGGWFAPKPKKPQQRFCNDRKKRCQGRAYEEANKAKKKERMRWYMRWKRVRERGLCKLSFQQWRARQL